MIPALVKPQQIEHILDIDAKKIKIFGTLDLESMSITASVTQTDGKNVDREMDNAIKRELKSLGYKNYRIVLQY